MPIFRVTYSVTAGSRWLIEDLEADRHDIRNNWHVLALVASVIGMPRWVCVLRVHDREICSILLRDGGVRRAAGRCEELAPPRSLH